MSFDAREHERSAEAQLDDKNGEGHEERSIRKSNEAVAEKGSERASGLTVALIDFLPGGRVQRSLLRGKITQIGKGKFRNLLQKDAIVAEGEASERREIAAERPLKSSDAGSCDESSASSIERILLRAEQCHQLLPICCRISKREPGVAASILGLLSSLLLAPLSICEKEWRIHMRAEYIPHAPPLDYIDLRAALKVCAEALTLLSLIALTMHHALPLISLLFCPIHQAKRKDYD